MIFSEKLRQDIWQESDQLFNRMIQWRRQIHRNPEIGLNLPMTAEFVQNTLKQAGLIPCHCGGDECSGVTTLIQGKKNGPTILLRADMDALPIQEDNTLPFRSEIKNQSHMCGHDTHTAMLLGAAYILANHRDDFCGNVKLMFQPGEEGYNGADYMVKDELLENPHVDAAIAMHCLTGKKWPTGTLLCATGLLAKASADAFTITIKGSGTHGATPESGTDVIYVLTAIANHLYEIRSRELSAFTPAMLSICSIQAGNTFNALPDSGKLLGTFRTFDESVREQIRLRIQEISVQIANALRCKASIKFSGGLAPTINDAKMCSEIFSYVKELDSAHTDTIGPVTGAEDFSVISSLIPSVYIDLSFGSSAEGYPYEVHSPKCLFNEKAMQTGAACYAWCAIRWLQEHDRH